MKGEAAIKRLGLLAGALVLLTACGGGSTASTVNAATAKSAADVGGMDALVTAAKKEGKLNIIATPPDWANYGAIIDSFKAKYGISIDSANPNGSSQDEINAVKQLGKTSRAPDVLDMGKAVTIANTELYAPYKVQTWSDIPDSQKESTGLYVQDYGGYMSIGYDSAKVPAVSSLQDLLGPGFRGRVALNGDPTKANAALNGVMMASLANGGSADRQARPDAGRLRLGLSLGLARHRCPDLEDFHAQQRHSRRLLQRGHQQECSPSGRRPVVGGIHLLRRRSEPLAQGPGPSRPHGSHAVIRED